MWPGPLEGGGGGGGGAGFGGVEARISAPAIAVIIKVVLPCRSSGLAPPLCGGLMRPRRRCGEMQRTAADVADGVMKLHFDASDWRTGTNAG
jgi:hypothetical protein